jgi:AmmeMemoRadiSam system protein B
MADRISNRKVREATHAGIFYPDEPATLEKTVRDLLAAAVLPSLGKLRGIISPHASLSYSGDLAALAWKASAMAKVSRIVILAPLHRASEASVYLPESLAYACPLGQIEVDGEAVEELQDCGTNYVRNDIPHLEEHGIEVQLPFARYLHPEALIVPILVGRGSAALVRSLASSLNLVFGESRENTLFVISTDLVFADSAGESARLSDRFLASLQGDAWEDLVAYDSVEGGSACGSGCVAALLASGLAGSALLLGRHAAGSTRESEDELHGEYAALALV